MVGRKETAVNTLDEKMKILVLDDEPQIRKLLKVALGAHGYICIEAATGEEAMEKAALFKPDMLVVDLGLPDMDGKEVVRQLREWSQAPVLILTARDQEQEKIEALDLGADDYVTKPFGTGELLARIRVCLRRCEAQPQSCVIQCGELCIDLARRRVTVEGRDVKLTPTEYDIMKVLGQNAGRVITHKQLLMRVWGDQYSEDIHYIRVYIGQIRRKIEKDPAQPRYIITESGIGYRLMDG